MKKMYFQTKKKSILALFVGTAMILSLGACGKEEKEEPVESLAQTTQLADYSSYVTLGQYTDLDIKVAGVEVTPQMLQERMDQAVEAYEFFYAQAEQITNRAVALGDTISIDFTTTVDGEAMDLLSGQDVSYEVGSGQIEKSLDEQLVGLNPGQSYDLDCTFGEDTAFTELAGKKVTFHINVNYIYGEVKMLEWGDELVTALTGGQYTDAEKYKEYLSEQLEEEVNASQQQEYEDGLWEAVLAGCTFGELPEDVIKKNAENYYASQREIFEYYATYYSWSYDEYIQNKQGMTDEEFHEKSYEYARTELERIYVAVTIFKELGMEFSDEEFSRGVAELADRYGYGTSAQFVETYGEEYVREVLIADKIEKYLLEHNHMIVEK